MECVDLITTRLVVRTAEIGRGIVLALFDDPAADGAGLCKQVEQLVALVPADGALQRREVLGEGGALERDAEPQREAVHDPEPAGRQRARCG